MNSPFFLLGALVASTLCSQASTHVVFSEDFDDFTVTSQTGGVSELGGAAAAVTHGQFFSSNNYVDDSGSTLDFTTDANANRTRGAGVWLDTRGWGVGTVTVTFDISGFVPATGEGSGSYLQTYTASGVNDTDAVGVDIHENFNNGVVLSGAASSGTLGDATAITADGTALQHTFTYSGEEQIGLFFVHQAVNGEGTTAAFSLDNLSVAAQTIQPNIIIFYVDDLGHQDVQINDLDDPCPYETPNMIKLAESGMNFTQAYSPAPTCSPSRAAINTGQHPAKTRFTHVTLDDMSDGAASELLIAPYLELQIDRNLLTSAEALQANGYRTGHSGKWHIGLNAANYGFETVNHSRGAHRSMSPDRLSDFATTSASDKYQLSVEKYPPVNAANPLGMSYPYDEVTESALQFIDANKDEPFFLNLCHWMVHWPVLTRNEELLKYYCDKLGHDYATLSPDDWTTPGQTNPYFAAMVTTVDWSLGRIVSYLEATDDPRNPGQKLIDTTYIFFSSDNGGAEQRRDEIISDNAPLRAGKGYVAGGGVRIPLVVSGPRIAAGTEFDKIVNQLDFFPTFLSLTETTIAPTDFAELSGLDIAPVLLDPTPLDAQVLDATGQEREFLFWHYPHYGNMNAALRSGDYKLHKSYETNTYELYRLYDGVDANNRAVRLDIEEANDLAADPAYASVLQELSGMLEGALLADDAELPYLNPDYAGVDPSTVAAPDVSSFQFFTREAQLTIEASGPKIQEASVIYCDGPTSTGDHDVVADEFISGMREPATLSADGYTVSAVIPESITAYCFMLVDENGYMQYTKAVDSPSVALPDALAHWSLDEDAGSQAADISGNGHHATVNGADWSVGVAAGALYFDGVSDAAEIPVGAVGAIDSQISIALWAYGGATQPANDVALYAINSAEARMLGINLPWGNGKIFWDAGGDRIISAVAAVESYRGKWNHWVFTKDTTAGSMSIYLNGAPFYSETGLTGSMSGITQAWLGSSGGFGGASYEGLLDEVMLYDVALSDLQVEALYSRYTPPTDYQAWLLNYPGLSDASFEGDPEQDGIATGLEFVLNGTPTESGEVILPEMDAAGEHFVFTFTRRAEAVPFTVQTFQYGSSLSAWTDLNITEPRASEVSLGSIVGGLQQVTVTIPKSLAVDGKLFGRLTVLSVAD
ncbi:sulfatase-like hydrolase/transferase [Coraliomargarita algicola]|uniref:Sulfatase-like hydrolase/transferase n=1 Tax=Coraliomargarita algicola TaxID=3092156 RepID=A0ABZ0RHN8_9BACT|nr:sulfatase-like hydrolase/transferase [Coraliomargarita sp. J2-16]WPJ95681.1 sulfatase-like hydrolase/transferase [Coraliomargarita sp. J2-16]